MRTKAALLELVDKSASAFTAPIDDSFWTEYGISHEDACIGALAMLEHLGTVSAEEASLVRRHWEAEKKAEQRKWRKREKKRRAKLTPQQRELEDQLAEANRATSRYLMDKLAEDMFKTTPFFQMMRGGEVTIKESPNTETFTEKKP